MKGNKLLQNLLITTLISGCTLAKSNLSIIVPTGAPSVAFLSELNNENFDTNTTPNNIVAEMLKGTYDIAVVDLIGGLTAIQMKNAPYKVAGVITFGNFYIYSTGNDSNNIMEDSDNIVGFGQGNTPDILFKHLYSNINIDTYVPGVSDVAPIAVAGSYLDEKVDYCVIAEPVLYNVLHNQKAPTYGFGYKYSDFQSKWKELHNDESSILGAAIYVKNETYENRGNIVDNYLKDIENNIMEYIKNPELAANILDEYGSNEQQAQKIGINSKVIKGVLEDNNSINLGYLSSKNENFNQIVNEYLNVVKPSIFNINNHL